MKPRLTMGAVIAAGVVLTLALPAGSASIPVHNVPPMDIPQEEFDEPTTPIVLTEQSEPEIVVMDPTADWTTDRARLWSWSPGPESELNAPESAWLHPDDARLRTDDQTGQQYVMVSDSYGLLAQVPYPDGGKVAWSIDGTFDAGPHGIDLLPTGNVAAAAAKGGWVRIYTASQGRNSEEYTEAHLEGAHQVLWSDADQLLWAVGDDELVSFEVGGTDAEPTIERAGTYELPTTGGHDIQPVSGDDDRLWVTSVYSVFQFVKTTEKWDLRYPRYRELYTVNVKSIATDRASGAILESVVQPENACSYCTDHIDLYIGDEGRETLTLPGSQIYRARWFDEAST